jgi:hypothetical protein
MLVVGILKLFYMGEYALAQDAMFGLIDGCMCACFSGRVVNVLLPRSAPVSGCILHTWRIEGEAAGNRDEHGVF